MGLASCYLYHNLPSGRIPHPPVGGSGLRIQQSDYNIVEVVHDLLDGGEIGQNPAYHLHVRYRPVHLGGIILGILAVTGEKEEPC